MRHQDCRNPRIRGGPTGFRGSMPRVRTFRYVLAQLWQPAEVMGRSACLPTKTDKLPSSSEWLHERSSTMAFESSPRNSPVSVTPLYGFTRTRFFAPRGRLIGTTQLTPGCHRSPAGDPWRRWQRETSAPASKRERLSCLDIVSILMMIEPTSTT